MRRALDAVLFDLDGVLTPTAEVHMRAWAALFRPFLATFNGVQPYGGAYSAYRNSGSSKSSNKRKRLRFTSSRRRTPPGLAARGARFS